MDGEGRNEREVEEKGMRDTYIRGKELGVFGLFRGSRHHGVREVTLFGDLGIITRPKTLHN